MITENLGVKISAIDWEEVGGIPLNNIDFEIGQLGLVLRLVMNNGPERSELEEKACALEVGSLVDIEINSGSGRLTTSFSDALLVQKAAIIETDASERDIIGSGSKQNGYRGSLLLGFRVGPVLHRE